MRFAIEEKNVSICTINPYKILFFHKKVDKMRNIYNTPPPPPPLSFENIWHIYFVAAHKLILNVSKIRLRLICARASYLYPLFSKVSVPRYRKEGGGSAQKRVCAANSKFGTVHGRSFLDALASIFCAILASALLISKNQTENLFSKARILFSAENIFTYINSG